MKTLIKITLILLVSISFFSCSEDTAIEQEAVSTENVVIPNDKQIEIEILEEINTYRISKGLSSLSKLNIIKSQTFSHTNHMVESNKISHDNFPSRSAFLKERTGAKKVGENVAVGFQTAESIVRGWVNSEGHRKNLEGSYTHFDISAEQNDNGTWFYTNIFVKK